MPHQLSRPVSDRRSRPRLGHGAGLLLAAVAALPACSSAGEEPPEPVAPPAAVEPDPVDAAPAPTSEPEAQPETPTTEPETQPDPIAAGEDELLAVWEAFHAAWVEQAAIDDPDPAAFVGLASDPEQTVAVLQALRGDARLVTTDVELWPRLDIAGDHAEVVDCAISVQHPDGQPDSDAVVTVGWEATAIASDDGWRIDAARPGELFCVAQELNDVLLAAYEAFRSAKDAAWDPPDPDHPDLERTMAGEQLDFIRGLLTDHRRDGIVVRDPAPTDNAAVFELGIGVATVSDCAEQVPERGAYDLDTGERLDELIPPISDGQLDLQSVVLVRAEDGVWRVVDQAGTRDTNCIPGSTNYAVS